MSTPRDINIVYAAQSPRLSDAARTALADLGQVILIPTASLTADSAVAQFKSADILVLPSSVVKHLTGELLSQLPRLKYITTTTSGCDWIDLSAARKLGIPVSNCQGANAQSVAEHTLGMIIDLSKRITEADREVRFNSAFNFSDFRGQEISGKTLGILGLGNVGSRLADMAKAFSLKILGFDLLDKHLPGVTQVGLEELLSASDILAILLPLTDSTRGLIGPDQVSRMKNGVIVVNTSREAIMDKSAILAGLSSGKIYGLGVDATILTPLAPDDPYFSFPNVIITPHNAFCTVQAEASVQAMWVENIKSFLSGHPQNIVN